MKRLSWCWMLFGLLTYCGAGKAQDASPLLPHEIDQVELPPNRPLEVAFCLDISGSMMLQHRDAARWILDRTHLWMARRAVRAALILYYDDAVFHVFDFQPGDRALSEGLAAAQPGVWGDELTGKYAALAASRLSWTPDADAPGTIEKRIVMVGNEAMIAGGFDYRQVVPALREQGWRLDAVEGSSRASWTVWVEKDVNQWQDFARLGGGRYERFSPAMTAPLRDGQPAPDLTPFDAEIRGLNAQYNQTLMPYGLRGWEKARRMEAQEHELDETGALFTWIAQKLNTQFPDWELIDAVQSNVIVLERVPDALLPAPWRGLKGDELRGQLQETLGLRRKIALLLRALLGQRQALLAAGRIAEINAARQRFAQMMANLQRDRQAPVRGTQTGTQINLDDVRDSTPKPRRPSISSPPFTTNGPLNSRTGYGPDQFDPTTTNDRINSADTADAAISQAGEAATKPRHLSNFDDEFTSPATLTRWQRTAQTPADAIRIDAAHGELILRDGRISKALDGDFAVTIRARIVTPNTIAAALTPVAASAAETPRFRFMLRASDPQIGQNIGPRAIGWQSLVADKTWQFFDSAAPGKTQKSATPSSTGGKDSFVVLRLARVGTHVFALSQDGDGTWKLRHQVETQWPRVVQIVLQSTVGKDAASDATAKDTVIQSHTPPRDAFAAHIDWVRFHRVSATGNSRPPSEVTQTADDAHWLKLLGQALDTREE